jgi:hypothetical protein
MRIWKHLLSIIVDKLLVAKNEGEMGRLWEEDKGND